MRRRGVISLGLMSSIQLEQYLILDLHCERRESQD
jgi:hypothetical protein